MRNFLQIALILSLAIMTFCSFPERKKPVRKKPVTLKNQSLPEIVLKDGQNHQFTFTNKAAGFFVGNTHQYNQTGFEGWTVDEVHVLTDYRILKNDRELLRSEIKRFKYHPYGFERLYRDGTLEEFTLLDSLNAILIRLKVRDDDDLFTLNPIGSGSKKEIQIGPEQPRVILETQVPENGFLVIDYSRSAKKEHLFLLRLADSSLQDSLSAKTVQKYEKLVQKRKERFKRLLNRSPFLVPNKPLQEALKWAVLSLDALVTRQRGDGIWAGLPWFNNYWGRDTFISLPGALLVTGKFDEAKSILRNFARFQLKDRSDKRLGRIPNRITNNEVIYNTADGTWWFIRSLYEYFLYTGDRKFLKEMFPVVRLAIEGAIKKRTDGLGFLRHGDAETWMDAVGSEGPWSPRGNRAVEIQALWYTALNIGVKSARILKQDSGLATKWNQLAEKVRKNFELYFWDEQRECLFDHLNADDSPDLSLRPNQIFALTVPDIDDIPPLLSKEKRFKVARKITENLVTEHGVLSLWFKDRNFHPYHHYLPYYVPDAAYHNGLIWTWLAGPAISSQAEFDQLQVMSALYGDEARQILRYDAIANYSELLEPVLRKGKSQPQISGTVSQAWSLAEFVRNFYQDFVGYRPLAYKNQVTFKPHLSEAIPNIRSRLPYKQGFLDVQLSKTETGYRIHLHSGLKNERIDGFVLFPEDSLPVTIFLPDSGTDFEYEFISMDSTADSVKAKRVWKLASVDPDLKFAVIHDLPFTLLKAAQVFFPLGHNGPTVIYKKDKLNDDKGSNGRYRYPQNKVFDSGIADIKSFTLYDNDSTWGFRIDLRNLTDPGWHPEYGFQLSYLAVAVYDEQLDGSASREIGRNAHYRLPASRAFNRVIYVGGGFEMRDAQNKRVALFVPLDKNHPLGFLAQKQIRFQIPKALLPGLNAKTRISVLAGLQDDHGGSGLGDFREVRIKAGQWQGGGAVKDDNAPAVFDVLFIN
ncbi:MAG: hypothetical protein GXO77_11280 [Calditrichaeota bacterium]|nr:hypothetical protein [Calditrichota bacterium]